jgi:hypothetical protein
MKVEEGSDSGNETLRGTWTGDVWSSPGEEWSENHFVMESVPPKLVLLLLYQSLAAPILFVGGARDRNDNKMSTSSPLKISVVSNNFLWSLLQVSLWRSHTVELLRQLWLVERL